MEWLQDTGRSFWQDLTLNEISGSLGDLGTFLPLLVGSEMQNAPFFLLRSFLYTAQALSKLLSNWTPEGLPTSSSVSKPRHPRYMNVCPFMHS